MEPAMKDDNLEQTVEEPTSQSEKLHQNHSMRAYWIKFSKKHILPEIRNAAN